MSAYADLILGTPGLVAYWRLNERQGTVARDSGANGLDGVYTGGCTLDVDGAIVSDRDPAVLFNGSTGYVTVTDDPTLDLADGPLTLELWMKRATTGAVTFFAKGLDAYLMGFDVSDAFQFGKDQVAWIVQSTAPVDDTDWHHLVATKNGSAVLLYIDGSDVTGTVADQTCTDNSVDLKIGCNTQLNSFFNGTLDDVAIYDAVLSPAEVLSHYEAGTASPVLIGTVRGSKYGRARAAAEFMTPSVFSARDEFEQAGGDLTSKTLPVGGTWNGYGDLDDFNVEPVGDVARRTAVSDVSINDGRCVTADPVLTDTIVQTDFNGTTIDPYLGVLARLADEDNHLRVMLRVGGTAQTTVYVYKSTTAGGHQIIAAPTMNTTLQINIWYTMRLYVDSAGVWRVWVYVQGSTEQFVAEGQDSDLVVGAARGSGEAGIYDAQNSATASQRFYNNFVLFAPSRETVILAGGSAKFLHDKALRESADEASYSRVPQFDGKHLKIRPATRVGRKSRIVVKARRFDVDAEMPDEGLTDGLTADLAVTPRVLLTGSE